MTVLFNTVANSFCGRFPLGASDSHLSFAVSGRILPVRGRALELVGSRSPRGIGDAFYCIILPIASQPCPLLGSSAKMDLLSSGWMPGYPNPFNCCPKWKSGKQCKF